MLDAKICGVKTKSWECRDDPMPKAFEVEIDAGYSGAGDDWESLLEDSDGMVSVSLRTWARSMRARADKIEAMANAVEADPFATGRGAGHRAFLYTRFADQLRAVLVSP